MRKLEVYADLWCPFAYVGLRQAIAKREELGSDQPFIIHPWPLELVNKQPLDPETTWEHAQDLRKQVAPNMFHNLDRSHFPTTTLPALALVVAMYGVDEAKGEAMSMAFRTLLFEDGCDISNPETLHDIATQFGCDPAASSDVSAVVGEWNRGVKRGVQGSPHFFCGEHNMFCPGLAIQKDDSGHLDLQTTANRLTSFLSDCLVD